MVEITVSHDNFNALMTARETEKVVVRHKNVPGEVCLIKAYHKTPKSDVPEVEVIEYVNQMDFGEALMRKMRQGYRISSTGCSDGKWRAILIKEVNNNDKD